MARGGSLASGGLRQARAQHLPFPGTPNFFFDNLVTPLLSVPCSFTAGGAYAGSGMPVGPPGLPFGTAHVGSTGGTGGLTQANAIESWAWISNPVSAFALRPSLRPRRTAAAALGRDPDLWRGPPHGHRHLEHRLRDPAPNGFPLAH